MAGIDDIPTELIIAIGSAVQVNDDVKDISALSQVTTRFYAILNPILYKCDPRKTLTACQALTYGNFEVLCKTVAAGASLAYKRIPFNVLPESMMVRIRASLDTFP